MRTIYVVSTNYGVETIAYTNKEEAEKARKKITWEMEMSGSRGMAFITEVQVADKFE